MKENYSAVLRTYSNGNKEAFVIPTELAKQNGIYDGYYDSTNGIAVECENFETYSEAEECAAYFEMTKKEQ